MVSSSDLKYKLIRYFTFNHYFARMLQDVFHVFLNEIIIYLFVIQCGTLFQGMSISIAFYSVEHYQLWMMDSKAQSIFLAKTPKLCV